MAAAAVIDVTLIKARVDAFAAAHSGYLEAQHAVEAAETKRRIGQAALAAREAEQDAAVEGLARALVHDGQPRRNPFIALHMPAPSRIQMLAIGEKNKAMRKLIAAVQGGAVSSDTVRGAADALGEVAQRMETEVAAFDKLEATVRATRDARQAAIEDWDAALAALKRGARAAADDGAPTLYRTLFGRPNRPKKKAAVAVTSDPGTPVPAAPASGQGTPPPTQ